MPRRRQLVSKLAAYIRACLAATGSSSKTDYPVLDLPTIVRTLVCSRPLVFLMLGVAP